jgi:hypothetical protein
MVKNNKNHFCCLTFKNEMLMSAKKQTISKAEIAEHFVTVEHLHDDLTKMVHDYYAQPRIHQEAI